MNESTRSAAFGVHAYRLCRSSRAEQFRKENRQVLRAGGLDDFAQAKVLERFHQALLNNDKAVLDDMIADQVIWVAERFGKGENLSKAQVLAHFGSKKEVKVEEHTRDHVRLTAFANTVVMTGNSTSVMKYKGQVSRGPRLFAIVYGKQNGRWQVLVHSIMDYDGML